MDKCTRPCYESTTYVYLYIAACEEEGKEVPENPYGMIEEFEYVANVIGSQGSLTTEALEDAIIDVEIKTEKE